MSKVVRMKSKLTLSNAFSKSIRRTMPAKLFSFACEKISKAFLVHSEIKCPGMYAFCSCPSNLTRVNLSLKAKVEDKNLYSVSRSVKGHQLEIYQRSLSPSGISATMPSLAVKWSSLLEKISCIAPNTIFFQNVQKTL